MPMPNTASQRRRRQRVRGLCLLIALLSFCWSNTHSLRNVLEREQASYYGIIQSPTTTMTTEKDLPIHPSSKESAVVASSSILSTPATTPVISSTTKQSRSSPDLTQPRRRFLEKYKQQQQQQTLVSYLPFASQKEFRQVCQTPPKAKSFEKKAGWRLMTQKVQVFSPAMIRGGQKSGTTLPEPPFSSHLESGAPASNHFHDKKSLLLDDKDNAPDGPRPPRLLCAVYTYPKHHHVLEALIETWGWRCDGFVAASTQTNATLGTVHIPHPGGESYDNMWMKTRSIWTYLYQYYYDDDNGYDLFYLSGDDTHLIVENLRLFVETLGRSAWQDQPLYLGHWIPSFLKDTQQEQSEESYNSTYRSGTTAGANHPSGFNDTMTVSQEPYYCGGGGGYLLNRVALKRLVEESLPICFNGTITSAEDRMIGTCLRRLGIVGNHTVDRDKAQLFHGSATNFVASYRGTFGFYSSIYDFWGKLYGYKARSDLVSSASISFHLLKTPEEMKRHHAILYRSCPDSTVLGSALALNATTIKPL